MINSIKCTCTIWEHYRDMQVQYIYSVYLFNNKCVYISNYTPHEHYERIYYH